MTSSLALAQMEIRMDDVNDHEPSRSYLACAEPAWAETVPERQLAGMLNLSCLLAETVYLTDIHVGDNSNFYHSYLNGKPTGLYARLRTLADMGFVRFLLRNESYRPKGAMPVFACETFSDVYRSWLANDPMEAWINQEVTENRAKYFRDLDSWALDKATERYNYPSLKLRFMENIRKACFTPDKPWFANSLNNLPDPIRSRYLELIRRDWFSLTDIVEFLQTNGLTGSNEFLMYNGLMNENVYGDAIHASLVGVDRDNLSIESTFWPQRELHSAQPLFKSRGVDAVVEEIIEHASQVLDGPSLSILALLSAEEIATLRSSGRTYFEFLDLSHDPIYVGANSNFGERFVQAASNYWNSISEYLASHHSGVVKKPTRLAIFLGTLPDPITKLAKISRSFFSFAINVGPTMVKEVIPGSKPVLDTTEKALKNFSLRFLFLCDTDELKRIRLVIPDRSWFARPTAKPE